MSDITIKSLFILKSVDPVVMEPCSKEKYERMFICDQPDTIFLNWAIGFCNTYYVDKIDIYP